MNAIEYLKTHLDLAIFIILGLMSLIMLWKTLERFWFLNRINLQRYRDIHQLDIALEKNLNPIYTVGANAPYVGLLGTVLGILITFYDMGQAGGDIEAGEIMIGLALALKATALGILVAIPSVMFYNMLSRKISVRRNEWLSLYEQR
ncbi:TonB-system energizer ExbB [Suttonella sp. R2A3]|uniref:TonB-system energizer ExbB n=1 Tax=Suttonella sp. R2A3 TaxID=2908648 RepID=UPI001F3D2D24|nr:TonB-system energizer ExbB [Suttonella sp. R2A3]UJF25078.1 TonB-system energizer ExbB [Suttonella sp. R2A3]